MSFRILLLLICLACSHSADIAARDCSRSFDADRVIQVLRLWQTLSPHALNQWWDNGRSGIVRQTEGSGARRYTTLQYPSSQSEQCACCDVFVFDVTTGEPHLLSIVMARELVSESEAVDTALRIWSAIARNSKAISSLNEKALTNVEAIYTITGESTADGVPRALQMSIEHTTSTYVVRLHVLDSDVTQRNP